MIGRMSGRLARIARTRTWGFTLAGVAAATVTGAAAGQVYSQRPPVADAPDDVQWPIHYGHLDREAVDAAAMVPGTAEHALRRFVNLHSADRFEDALVAIREVLAVAPDRPLAHYNHACVLARLGELDAALDALDAAREHGWRDALHAQVDSDLRSVRSDPQFGTWLDAVRADRAAEAPVPRRRRLEPWPQIVADVDAIVPDLMARHHVPGMAVALVRSGDLVWSDAHGVADERRTPFSLDQPFASDMMANLLAFACAVELEAAQRFDLERLIISDDWSASRAADAATAFRSTPGRHLVSRRTGDRVPIPATRQLCVWPSEEERCRGGAMLRQRLNQHLLGHFASFAEQRVAVPFGLRATSFGPLAPSVTDQLINGHTALGTCLPAADVADGDVVTTTADLQRMMVVLMRDQRTAFETKSGRRLHELVRDDLALKGLGFSIIETVDGAVVQGVSMHDGIGCVIRFWPEHQDGVVIVFNATTGTGLRRCGLLTSPSVASALTPDRSTRVRRSPTPID